MDGADLIGQPSALPRTGDGTTGWLHGDAAPAPAVPPDQPVPDPVADPLAEPVRTTRGVVVVVLLVALVIAGGLGLATHGYGVLSFGHGLPAVRLPGGAADAPRHAPAGPGTDPAAPAGVAGGRSVSAPLADTGDRQLDLLTDSTRTTVRSADLADRLYQVTSADDSATPSVTARGAGLELHLVRTGKPGADSVDILLNSRVRWTLRLTGAAAEYAVDMTAGGLAGIDVVGGASRVTLSLPAPTGTQAVRIAGAVSECVLHAPRDVPVRVQVGGGADSATIDATAHPTVAPGTVFAPAGWDLAGARYDIATAARIGVLRLDRS